MSLPTNILFPIRRSRHRIERMLNNILTESADHDVTTISDPIMVPIGSSTPVKAYLRMQAGGSISGTLFGVYQVSNSIEPTFDFPTKYNLMEFKYDGPSISGVGMLGLSGGTTILVRGTLSFDVNTQLTTIEIGKINGGPIEVTISTPGYVFFSINFKFKVKCGGIIGGNCPCRPSPCV